MTFLCLPCGFRQARRVLPLIKNHNLLLVTLVLGNAAAAQTLPIFFDRIVPTVVAVILSVTAMLFFGTSTSTSAPMDAHLQFLY